MSRAFERFQEIVRRSYQYTEAQTTPAGGAHPFDSHNIHPSVSSVSIRLFDDGHYSQATFETYKFLDKEVQRIAGSTVSGKDLMMKAFAPDKPMIQLTPLNSASDRDEQDGYKFLFAGSIIAIRNPRGHEVGLPDSPDECLDHLSLASLLLRRLESAGFSVMQPD